MRAELFEPREDSVPNGILLTRPHRAASEALSRGSPKTLSQAVHRRTVGFSARCRARCVLPEPWSVSTGPRRHTACSGCVQRADPSLYKWNLGGVFSGTPMAHSGIM
jgi:hypothetical protein